MSRIPKIGCAANRGYGERFRASGAVAEMGDSEIDVGVRRKRVEKGSIKELEKRLNRDPSVISRLHSAHAEARDERTEAVLLRQLRP